MSITAERIKKLRKQKQLTQQGLADIIESSRDTIANYENDRNKSTLAMLTLIADALDTTVEYLQGKTDSPLKTPTVDDNGDDKKHVDLADDELIMSFEGKELSEDYKNSILAFVKMLREERK